MKVSACQQQGSQQFCSGRGWLNSVGRRGGTGGKCDAIAEAEKGFVMAPTANFGKCPWDSEVQTGPSLLSYHGSPSPSFPSRAWLSPKEKKTNYDFRVIVLFLEGTTQRLWACLMFSQSLSPPDSSPLILSHLSSFFFPFFTKITKRIYGHCRDFGKHRRVYWRK